MSQPSHPTAHNTDPTPETPARRSHSIQRGRTGTSRPWERVIEGIIFFCGITSILFVALIFLFILKEAVPLFWKYAAARFFTGTTWYPADEDFGLLPLLLSSVLVTLGAIVLAVPLGLTAAIYIAEIAPRKIRDFLKATVELLAALPSVVLGFFGMVVLEPFLQKLFHLDYNDNLLVGAITLAFMAVPTIATISEDAIAAVPRDQRAGSLGLGASHWQTIARVMVPGAFSGIVAAVMLGIGRAIGETMVVLMVTGNNIGSNLTQLMTAPGAEAAEKLGTSPTNPLAVAIGIFQHTFFAFGEIARTITGTIAAEMGEVAPGEVHYHVLFMLGVVLFVITFLINLVADLVLQRSGVRR